MYSIGGLIFITLLQLLFLSFIDKEYEQLFDNLLLIRRNNPSLVSSLNSFMVQHEQIWKIVEEFKVKFGYPFLCNYVFIVFSTSYYYYMYFFRETVDRVANIYLELSIISTIVCVIYGLKLSSLSFKMQNGFQDIRLFAVSDTSVEILNFMKRFGKVPLVLSMGGFFYITKRFPIKMFSSLHSVFSGLLKLRTISYRNGNCKGTFTDNATHFYEI
ncbi:uncharacterized protein LOC111637114 [Centruroides sculpturatus]|uniref:uncharacterized protein LOC111637114 n=1 Tax=Centruroides sculpturatus TaxID=218467 RepID=UPI000C6DF181|nr:uncharacterized protein LOC111637114 [Centruroides sculpturatus]